MNIGDEVISKITKDSREPTHPHQNVSPYPQSQHTLVQSPACPWADPLMLFWGSAVPWTGPSSSSRSSSVCCCLFFTSFTLLILVRLFHSSLPQKSYLLVFTVLTAAFGYTSTSGLLCGTNWKCIFPPVSGINGAWWSFLKMKNFYCCYVFILINNFKVQHGKDMKSFVMAAMTQ